MSLREKNTRAEWDRRNTAAAAAVVERVAFADVLDRFLPRDPSLRSIEIGAVPGTFLAYFRKAYGYHVTGLDFSAETEVFHETMRINGVSDYEFIDADFLTYEPTDRYDVVASFGFIEHFDDYQAVVRKHIDLLAPGGYLVLAVPHFRNLQYVYHRIFDWENLAIHNVRAMHLRRLERYLRRSGLIRLFAGYHGALWLWYDAPPRGRVRRYLAEQTWRINKLGKRLPDSRLYSAFALLVYRQPEVARLPERSGS